MEACKPLLNRMEAILAVPKSLGGGNRAEIDAAEKRQARADTEFFDLVGNWIICGEENDASSTAAYSTGSQSHNEVRTFMALINFSVQLKIQLRKERKGESHPRRTQAWPL